MSPLDELDRTDLDLLRALADDPRAPHSRIAQRVGISRNTVLARVRRLLAISAFQSFDRSINPSVLGYPLEAWARITIRQQLMFEIVAELDRLPEILQVQALNGGGELLAHMVAHDPPHLLDLTASMLTAEGVEGIETSLAARDLIPFRLQPLLRFVRETSVKSEEAGDRSNAPK